MNIYQGRFLISRDREGETWAEPGPDGIRILRGKIAEPEKARLLLTVTVDQVQRLYAWAQPQSVVVPFTGLLAKEIKEAAGQLGLTSQNFVVEALNAFLQAGQMAAHNHAEEPRLRHAPPQGQDIELER